MVKPARLGSSVGMTLVHDPSELDAALETAFRHDTLALAETYLPGARDLEVAIIGNDPAGLELYGPGEIVSGHEFYDYAAKYTAGLSETSTRAEVTDRQRATMLKIARDAYRAIGAEGFARVDFLLSRRDDRPVRDQHDPGVHPDQPLPDDAGRGRLHVRRRLRPDRRARARAPRGPGRPPPDRRGPAPMSGRPVARRSRTPVPGPPRPLGPARVGRAVGGPRRGGPRDARRRPPRSTASAPRRPSTTRSSRSTARQFTDPAAVEAALGGGRGENLFGLSTGPLVAALESHPDGRGRPGRGPPAGHARGDARRSDADPRLAGRRAPLPGGQRRFAVRRGGRPAPAGAAALPVVDDRRAASPACSSSARRSTRSTSTRPPGSPRSSPADVGSGAVSLGVAVTDENGFVVGTRPEAGPRSSASTRPSLRTTELIPEPGPAAAQPPRRPRANGRAGHPGVRDGRHLRRHGRARPPRPSPRPSRRRARLRELAIGGPVG